MASSAEKLTGKATLTTWGVNKHRAFEVLGPEVLAGHWSDPGAVAELLGRQVMRWMQEKEIESYSFTVFARSSG